MTSSDLSQPKEIYGRFIEILSISTQSKNLQHLANDLFVAAQLDLQLDAKNKVSNHTTHFNHFIDSYLDRLGVSSDSKENVKQNLSSSLLPLYSDAKSTLKKVRVFNVGKTNFEKAMTAAGNVAKAFTPMVTGCCILGAAAMTYFSFEEGMKAWGSLFKGDAMGYFISSTISNLESDAAKSAAVVGAVAANFGFKRSVELSSIKSGMKKILSNQEKLSSDLISSRKASLEGVKIER